MLPFILHHALMIVNTLVSNFAIIEDNDVNNLKSDIGMILCFNNGPLQMDISEFYDDMVNGIEDLGMVCPHCNSAIEFDEELLLFFYDTGMWKCKKCNAQLSVNE
jgi:hypothetical protein